MTKKQKAPAKKVATKIALTTENLELLQDLNRAVGMIEAVHDTTKGERRATVLLEAINLISKHLP